MILSIFNSKKNLVSYLLANRALIFSVLIILLIEASTYLTHSKKEVIKNINRNNILNLNFFKKDSFSEWLISEKNYLFLKEDFEILTIGDSSALHGFQPKIIGELTGLETINAACCSDYNWNGYDAILENYLRNNHNIKYVILYFTPYALPEKTIEKFGEKLSSKTINIYSSFWSFFHQIPSLYFRKEITDMVYYSAVAKDFPIDAKQNMIIQYKDNFTPYNVFIRSNLGWFPNIKTQQLSSEFVGECSFGNLTIDPKNKKSLTKNLEKINQTVKKYGKRLIVITNPVPCRQSINSSAIIQEFNNFKRNNKDVIIPFDLIHSLEEENFTDQYHLKPESAEVFSVKIAEKIIEAF